MDTLGDTKLQKSCAKYFCEVCDYTTDRKSSYDKHLFTLTHKTNSNGDKSCKKLQKSCNKKCDEKSSSFLCENCGKEYKYRQGLWKHKKKCKEEDGTDEIMNDKELIQYLMKENSEFKQLMIDQNKQMVEQNKQMCQLAKNSGHHNNNTTSNVVNNNQQFNLNVYLNETCKNAMNIMDFVSQLNVSITDLEETGRLGYAEGISKIFINGLKQINVNDRPIHCSDQKRETLYIKDNNEWNKDSDDKAILTNAIKHVARKNMKKIPEWTKQNPEFKKSTSKVNDKYLKIVSEAMSGTTEEESNKNYAKIIKNIVRETVIDK
jgi:hypothetical protein